MSEDITLRNARNCKKYYLRKKSANQKVVKKKSNSEKCRQYRQRKKLLAQQLQSKIEVIHTPSTSSLQMTFEPQLITTGYFSTETMDIEEQKPIIVPKKVTSTSTVLAALKSEETDEGYELEQIMSDHNYHKDKCMREETVKKELRIKKENAEDFSIAEDNTECCSTEYEEVLTMKCEVFDEPLIPEETEEKELRIKKEEIEEKEPRIKKENAEYFSLPEDNRECCSTEDEEEVLTMKCEVFDEPLIPFGASHDLISGASHDVLFGASHVTPGASKDVVSVKAYPQVTLGPQDVCPAVERLYLLEVSPLILQQKKKAKTNAQRQREYRQRKKEKERLNKIKKTKKIPKTNAEHQREYRRRKKLEMESLSPKRKPKTRAECKKQFRLKQKMLLQSEQLDSNVARSGSGNDVTSATAQIQVKLEPQDELPVENSLYFEVPPLIRRGSPCNFVTFASELVQVKVEYEEDDRSSSEPLRMEFP